MKAKKFYENILEYRDRLSMAEDRFLRHLRWDVTCTSPDSRWYWTKTFGDQKHLCNKETAISIEKALLYK